MGGTEPHPPTRAALRDLRRLRQIANFSLEGVHFNIRALSILIGDRGTHVTICASRSLRRIETPQPTFGVQCVTIVGPIHAFWNLRV
jgi:hypothetical protein